MISINYEAWVYGPTAKHRVYIRAVGTTPEEVRADALRQADSIGAVELMAVSCNNREADWISAFGTAYTSGCRFADSPVPAAETKRVSMWPQRITILILLLLFWLTLFNCEN